ncbi:MAG: hypothetical protein SH819_01865 [Cytophagales bacterium]|nr:hypothetical protein [Cytophagales bacterium]
MTAVEKNSTISQKIFRFLDISGTSFSFDFISKAGTKLFTIRKGFTWFASRTNIMDANANVIGILHRNLLGVDGDKYNLKTDNDKLILKIIIESGTFNYKFKNEADKVFAKVLRDSEETRKKQKEIVTRSGSLRSIYLLTTTVDMNTDLATLWLLVSAVVSIDLTFMDRADASESYS